MVNSCIIVSFGIRINIGNAALRRDGCLVRRFQTQMRMPRTDALETGKKLEL